MEQLKQQSNIPFMFQELQRIQLLKLLVGTIYK